METRRDFFGKVGVLVGFSVLPKATEAAIVEDTIVNIEDDDNLESDESSESSSSITYGYGCSYGCECAYEYFKYGDRYFKEASPNCFSCNLYKEWKKRGKISERYRHEYK